MVVLLILFPAGLVRAPRMKRTRPRRGRAARRIAGARSRSPSGSFPSRRSSCFPTHRVLGSQILITGLFAVSLDLILGYAGIVSLGHAAFFGIGAYAAGLLAVHGWGEPLTGSLVAGAARRARGFRRRASSSCAAADLARLMVTLGIGLMLFEAANQAAFITGGVDGLSGVTMWKLLGVCSRSTSPARTAYLYSLAVLFVLFVLARRIVNSPFGLSLRGVRENVQADAGDRRAGDAAADRDLHGQRGDGGRRGRRCSRRPRSSSASTSFGFPRSADLMIMLVLGGAGRLYGGLVGTTVFMIAHDYLSDLNPMYWQFWLGLLLVVVVLFARGGILGRALRRAMRD